MINPPGYKVRAIYASALNIKDLEVIKNIDDIEDEKMLELEVWEYNPKLFTNKGVVDKVSLYSSLKNKNDERIEQALEEALRDESWYTD